MSDIQARPPSVLKLKKYVAHAAAAFASLNAAGSPPDVMSQARQDWDAAETALSARKAADLQRRRETALSARKAPVPPTTTPLMSDNQARPPSVPKLKTYVALAAAAFASLDVAGSPPDVMSQARQAWDDAEAALSARKAADLQRRSEKKREKVAYNAASHASDVAMGFHQPRNRPVECKAPPAPAPAWANPEAYQALVEEKQNSFPLSTDGSPVVTTQVCNE